MQRKLLLSFVAVFSLFVFSSISNTAYAATSFYAAPTDQGTHDCLSSANACDLQQALDAANTGNADSTINLAAGTYSGTPTFLFEHAAFAHSLTLVGAGTSSTFITAADHGMALAAAGAIEVSGINFKDNVYFGLFFENTGTGNVYVHDNKFETNGSSGMYMEHDTGAGVLEISDNIFTGNESTNRGSGLGIFINSDTQAFPIDLAHNTFSDNNSTSNGGGGAYIISNADNSLITVNGNSFTNNTSSGANADGGGLYIHTDGDHSGVSVGEGGAEDSNTFEGNTADRIGGGLYIVTTGLDSDIVVGTDVEDGGNTFEGNEATTSYAGGMMVDTDGNDSSISVSRNMVQSNTATTSGGIYVDTNGSGEVEVTVTNNTIGGTSEALGNTATDGNAGGGTVYARRGLNFLDNIFGWNEAHNIAGGVSIQIDGGPGDTTNNYVSNNTFTSNTAGCGRGGGFYMTLNAGGSLTINANKITENATEDRGGCTSDGGGGSLIVSNTGFQTVMTNNLFADNNAAGQGGGLYYHDVSFSWGLSMVNSTFADNSSTGDGGGATFDISNTGGENYLTNNIFWGDNADGDGDDIRFETMDGANNGFNYNDFGELCLNNSGVVCNPANGLLSNFDESNNSSIDPDFQNVDGGDFSLRKTSRLIDKGTNDTDYITDEDINGSNRIVRTYIDLGAYESTAGRSTHRSSSGKIVSLLTIPVANAEETVPLPVLQPSFVFERTLRSGMTGEDVKELQKFLNAHGYPVAAVGPGSLGNETTLFGPKTKAALIAFQKAHSPLSLDGILGPKSIAVIMQN